jgi:prepilin-type N-terminal cleavage/methylation domain-containing protein
VAVKFRIQASGINRNLSHSVIKNNRLAHGFTLVELVLVVLLLSVLAVTILPRYIDTSDEAEQSVIESALGSVKSASAITHTGWLLQDDLSSTQVIAEDGTVLAMQNGYPTAEGMCLAAGLQDFNCTYNDRDLTVSLSNQAGDRCFIYRAPTLDNTEPFPQFSTQGFLTSLDQCSGLFN